MGRNDAVRAGARSHGPGENQSASKKNIVAAIKDTADRLGNRPATCKKYYVHPAVLEAYESGTLFSVMKESKAEEGAYNLAARKLRSCVCWPRTT